MYSRFPERPPIRVPEHYSGCAFTERKDARYAAQDLPPKQPPAGLEIGKPTAPPQKPTSQPTQEFLLPPPVAKAPPDRCTPPAPPPSTESEPPKDNPPPPPPPPPAMQTFQNLFGHLGNAFPFSHGIGFDELLILSLILLLSRNGEQDSDLILLLGLLLFCG